MVSSLESGALAGSPSQLQVSLAVPDATYQAAAGVFVDFTLVNRAAAPVSVLTWNTPFEGFQGDSFLVTQAGQPVPYVGRLVKRAHPQPSDYLTLGAGEAKTIRVNLAEAYAIDGPGAYQVRFEGAILDRTATPPTALQAAHRLDTAVAQPLTSAVVTVLVSTGRAVSRPGSDLAAAGVTPAITTFRSCSSTEKSQLATALSNAHTLANTAASALANTAVSSRPNARRSLTWFGAYTADRYGLAETHFTKIATSMARESYTFDCGCTESSFAYVYPSQPYVVHLCRAFWPAPALGTDSKAGTLVHEASHFTVLGGTKDYAYGQASAQALAKSDPGRAVMNADSHEYFAENHPAIPQP